MTKRQYVTPRAKRQYVTPRELLGGTIQSVITSYNGETTIVVDVPVRKRGGKIVHKLFHCETWRDPEGNGPGFLYVEDLESKGG